MAKPELWEHVLTGRALQGEANAVIGRLCQSILGYARHGPPPNYEYYNCVYVGRTQDLWTRFDRHKTEWRNKGMTLHHMIEPS